MSDESNTMNPYFGLLKVHRCVHRKSKVQYAVKIINTRRFSLSPGLSTKELREEAEIMRNLNHPHIIRIQDAFELDHILYIVMELVTGGDLFDKIIELGRYGEDDARRVLIKVQPVIVILPLPVADEAACGSGHGRRQVFT